MSTFVLKREYALQLPTSFVDVESDEMEYVDGGIGVWSKTYYNKNGIIGLAILGVGTGLFSFAAAVTALTITGVTGAAAILTAGLTSPAMLGGLLFAGITIYAGYMSKQSFTAMNNAIRAYNSKGKYTVEVTHFGGIPTDLAAY